MTTAKEIPGPDMPLTLSQAQCSMCRRVFSRVGNFDRHLVRHKHGGETVRVTCRNPALVGLVQNAAGIWKSMPDQKSISLFRGQANQPTKPKRRVRG